MFRIGSLELTSNLFLSPLAGYTNLPFRLTLRELGGLDLATTDLVNARSLLEKKTKALKLIETCPADRPLAVQLFGAVPEEMRAAAQFLEALGISSVDINMGCPVRKVVNVGGGSAMMTDLDKTSRLVRGMVEAVKIPVTAKMRLGWDDANLTAPDLARALEDAGVAAVFVHGRTREQGFGGTVKLAGIRAVVQAVRSIPVIGNGDVVTPQSAKRMLDETGCAGVSIGRGAFYHPWIFAHTAHYLRTGARHVPAPGPDDRGVWRGARLPDVPQDRAVVLQAVRAGERVQQAGGAGVVAGGVSGSAGELSALAAAVPRRARGVENAVSAASAGGVVHARAGRGAGRAHRGAQGP